MPVAKLDNSPRCRHTKADGSPCKAPALRNHDYCHFHLELYTPAHPIMMPVIEDAHSLQVALQIVLRAVLQGTIDRKTGSTVLYGLQIAASNLKRLAQERETVETQDEGARQHSLVQYLIDQLDLEPEDDEKYVGAGAPACTGERSSPDVAQPPSAVHSEVIPEIRACSARPCSVSSQARRFSPGSRNLVFPIPAASDSCCRPLRAGSRAVRRFTRPARASGLPGWRDLEYLRRMEASLHPHSTCTVLRLSGDLRLWSHKQAEERLLSMLPADMSFPGNRLVLGLAGLTQIDSLGIGFLVKILLGCVKNNVGLCTVLPPGLAGQSIRSTRIFAAWPEFDSEEAAVSQSGERAAS